MSATILVVDDKSYVRALLEDYLVAAGYTVVSAESGEEALTRLAEREFDLILTDVVMPGITGLDLLERSHSLNPRAAVLLMTAYPTVDTAITALRRGACDYLEKPFNLDDLETRVQRVLEHRDEVWRERLLQRARHPRPAGHPLLGESAAIHAVREQIALSAPSPSNVLITGESGVGKELVARSIHAASRRQRGAFVAVNCGAIPESLLESQLFGHVRGAFTTALQTNPGLFVAAAGGTVLLDEIGELPLALQVKLLRVIEEREVWPVGGTRAVAIDVRIVASTNRDLAREIEAGRFRQDLFYRLDVVHIHVPPLRERRGDIPLIVEHLVARLNAKLGTHYLGVERNALWALVGQRWKGNVRELENVLERAMVLGSGELISLDQLSRDIVGPDTPPRYDLREALRQFERQHLRAVLAEAQSDKREAARLLGISLASLYRKLTDDAASSSN
jgi:DNA-binding NtrC family response regulator